MFTDVILWCLVFFALFFSLKDRFRIDTFLYINFVSNFFAFGLKAAAASTLKDASACIFSSARSIALAASGLACEMWAAAEVLAALGQGEGIIISRVP